MRSLVGGIPMSGRVDVRFVVVLAALAQVLTLPALTRAQGPYPQWPTGGVPVQTTPTQVENPKLVTDGTGGVIALWGDVDPGATGYHVRAQRLGPDGSRDPRWPDHGVRLGPWAGRWLAVADGEGGCYVVVGDNRVVRVAADGVIPAGFQTDGGVATSPQLDELAVDRNGVVWCLWDEAGFSCIPDFPNHCSDWTDVRVVRMDREGGYLPGWPPPGRVVHTRSRLNHMTGLGARASGSGITFGMFYDYHSGGPDFFGAGLGRINDDGTSTFAGGFGADGILARAAYDGHPTAGDFVQFGASFGSLLLKYGPTGPVWSQPWTYPPPNAFSWNPDGVVSDGNGGAYARTVIYAGSAIGTRRLNHVLSTGVSDAGWPVGGLSLDGVGVDRQSALSAVQDGRGGCFIAWSDTRSGTDADVYVQRYGPDASVPAGWATTGQPIAVLPGTDQSQPALAGDGESVFVGWRDSRQGGSNLFVQKFGAQSPVPAQVQRTSAEWVGGRVELSWELADSPDPSVVVERCSGDPVALGAEWSALGPLELTSTPRSWSFLDVPPASAGRCTYRLHERRTGWTGGEVSIQLPYRGALQLGGVSPNPVRGVPRVTVRASTLTPIELSATDVQGRVRLKRRHMIGSADSETFEWSELSQLPAGLYWLTARQGGDSRTLRFVVTR